MNCESAMRTDIHVLLVSDQATPNITPLLDPALRPAEVALVTSPDKTRQAEWLEQALQDTGIRMARIPIADAWDLPGIADTLLDWLAGRGDQTVALNVTGGTKLMSIAAYEVFRGDDRPVYYIHPEYDRLIWLAPAGLPSQDLADRIKLPRFLAAHGATVVEQGSRWGVPEPLRRLTEDLVLNIGSLAPTLGRLNHLAHTAEQTLLSQPIAPEALRHPGFRALQRKFSDASLLQERDDGRLAFPDEASRFFVNGGWLEDHVYGLCLNLKKELRIQDIGRGLKVERKTQAGAVRNEIDLALLKDNRLHIVECKTGTFAESQGGDKGAETLYKLDTLTELLGGLKAKAMLVSYKPLRPADLQRATDLRIEVCQANDLRQLPELLKRWIR